MPSMLSTACQNAVLKGAANLTAQVTANWHSAEFVPIDRQRILEFAIYGFVGANINYLWQDFLENTFPTRRAAARQKHHFRPVPVGDKDDGGKSEHHAIPMVAMPPASAAAHSPAALPHGPSAAAAAAKDGGISWFNVLAKLVADMTLGLGFMICVLLVITNVARVQRFGEILDIIRQKLFHLLAAGWHIWPIVGLISFVWIPVRWRVLVGGCIGFGWNIFLSIVAVSTTPIPAAAAKPGG